MSANDAIVTACWVALKHHGQIGLRVDPDAFLASLSAAGYAVVPKEPTSEMCSMGADELPTPTCESTDEEAAAEVYRAMLAASEPQP